MVIEVPNGLPATKWNDTGYYHIRCDGMLHLYARLAPDVMSCKESARSNERIRTYLLLLISLLWVRPVLKPNRCFVYPGVKIQMSRCSWYKRLIRKLLEALLVVSLKSQKDVSASKSVYFPPGQYRRRMCNMPFVDDVRVPSMKFTFPFRRRLPFRKMRREGMLLLKISYRQLETGGTTWARTS